MQYFISGSGLNMEREWLKERRELFIKNIVKDFFECYAFFNDLKAHTASYGIRYDGFDFWVGTEENRGRLWILKDLCHLIWGGCTAGSGESDGVMLDWMIGAIFHEAMKLKENAYMIERYRMSFPDKAAAIFNGKGTRVVQEFFEEMTSEAKQGILRMQWLFEHAEGHLFEVMKAERSNPLLVRFLLEVTSRGQNGAGNLGDGPVRLLETLFPDGLDMAYCLAGESYMEGGWFNEARRVFERALRMNPECKEAKSGIESIERRVQRIGGMTACLFNEDVLPKKGAYL